MGTLLPISRGVPSKLLEPFAGTLPTDGPDRLSYGGCLSAGGARAARSRPAIAGSLSARGNLRARLADGDRTAGGPTGPAAGGMSTASGESAPGAAPGTRAVPVVRLSSAACVGGY